MKATIHISGRIEKEDTLIDVIRQFKSYEDVTEVLVEIDSNGGNKPGGDAVYNYLVALGEEIPVTTRAKKAFSIAAKIFAAGSKRIVVDAPEVVGVHFARVKPVGYMTAEQLEGLTAELYEIKTEFINFYSDHLKIDKNTVEALLENETILSGEKSVELGFATELENSAEIVAELDLDKFNIEKMSEKKKVKNSLKKLLGQIEAYLNGEEVVAEVTLQDSNGSEMVFPDVEEGSVPKVGDKATIDGEAVSDGSYIMPGLEDSTVVFVGGVITEINEKEVEEVVAEEIKEICTWSMESVNTSFELGETVMFEGWDGEEPYAARAGEFKLGDGRSVVTDASGVIVKIKEADSEEQVIEVGEDETEASFEDLLGKVTTKVKAEIEADFEAKLAESEKEIKSLKAKFVSKEIIADFEDEKPKEKVTQANVLRTRKKQS